MEVKKLKNSYHLYESSNVVIFIVRGVHICIQICLVRLHFRPVQCRVFVIIVKSRRMLRYIWLGRVFVEAR